MDEKKIKDEKALENRCPSCKASIKYNPKVKKWKCDYCGSEFTLEEMQKFKDNASTEEKNKKEEKKQEEQVYINYHCESCGAEIIADEATSATFCVYCGNTAILQSKLEGKFSPDYIIPFQKEKQIAIDAFKNLSKGRPFVPRDFNKETNIEKIRGIYIPFWLYDFNVSGDIVMDAKIVHSWTRGNTHYTKTSTFQVTRGGKMDFSMIPVDGSTHFDNDIMNTIEPFHYNELIPYNHAYLSGFYAEKYDVASEDAKEEAINRAIRSAKDTLEADAVGYTSKIILNDNLEAKEKSTKYALLPVWMVNVKYNNKMHTFAMNGQTGEFIGNIPLDKRKVVLYTIAIWILSLAICIALSYMLYITGGK